MARRAHLATCLAAVVGYVLLPEVARPWAFAGLSLAFGLGMVAVVVHRRFADPLPWLLTAAGQVCFGLGDLAYEYLRLVVHVEPFPSVADAAYLAAYGLLVAGLLLLVRRRARGGDVDGLLDAGIVTTGSAMLAWVALVSPSGPDDSLGALGQLLLMAYPLVDLLLLGLLLRLAFSPSRMAGPVRLLGYAIVAQLVADAGYAAATLVGLGDATGTATNVVWLIGYALASSAVLHPAAAGRDEAVPAPAASLGPRRLLALTAAALVGPVLLLVETPGRAQADGAIIGLGSLVLFVLVMLRMAGLFRRVQAQARELSELAGTDALTGVANRRRWEGALPSELGRAARTGQPVCVALLDLDHFKRYNDRLGHPAGDALLRAAAASWRSELRCSDVVARYGGEEFAVLLAGCEVTEALDIAQRLRAGVPDGQTCSIGLACWDGHEGADVLVGRADVALYLAKSSGRDRVVVDRRPELSDLPDRCELADRTAWLALA